MVFRQYGNSNKANQFSSASTTCDLTEDHLAKNDRCQQTWERGFSLWAMRNYALFLQRYYTSISNVINTVSLSTGSIADNFAADGGEDIEMNDAAWYTLASGIITAGTAFLPAFGQVTGGSFGGIFTALAGIAGAMGTVEDPRFTTFADLQSNLGKLKESAQAMIDKYFDRLFRNSPPNKDTDKGTELAKLLQSGIWAEQDTAELSYKESDIIRMIHSSMISELWNAQQFTIVRFSKSTLNDIWGKDYDFCFDNPNDDVADWVACVGDYNYLLVSDIPSILNYLQPLR